MTARVRKGECWCLPQTDGDWHEADSYHQRWFGVDCALVESVGVCSPEDDASIVTASPCTLTKTLSPSYVANPHHLICAAPQAHRHRLQFMCVSRQSCGAASMSCRNSSFVGEDGEPEPTYI